MRINIMNYFKYALSILFITLLSSCTFMSPVTVEQNTYVINALPQVPCKASARKDSLLVAMTDANPVYNTPQIAYSTCPYQVAYYAKNRWADTPAGMLQPLIVQALQRTHYFHAVTSTPSLGHYDYVLAVQLLKLQHQFVDRCSFVHLTLRAEVVDVATNHILGIKQISVTQLAPCNNPYGAVIAANRAAASAIGQLTGFTLSKMSHAMSMRNKSVTASDSTELALSK